jgi:2-methylisocitrate lyase-like PEP mutase family enzyme
MDKARQAQKAAAFRALHDPKNMLVLPNAWDAISARIFEAGGFPAVATTSAGVAWALGYADGQVVPRAEMVEAVRRITRVVSVPVTADLEAGYGPKPEDAAETVRVAIDAGAIGMNLEDSNRDSSGGPLVEPAAHAAKVRAVRAAADAAGVPFVINARTDVYLASVGEPGERFDHTVRRAKLYLEAGADCIFIPYAKDPDTIGKLTRAVPGPINILAGPGVPPIPELRKLGVARLSVGSGPASATLGLLRRIAEELAGPGTFTSFTESQPYPYAELNRLLTARPG